MKPTTEELIENLRSRIEYLEGVIEQPKYQKAQDVIYLYEIHGTAINGRVFKIGVTSEHLDKDRIGSVCEHLDGHTWHTEIRYTVIDRDRGTVLGLEVELLKFGFCPSLGHFSGYTEIRVLTDGELKSVTRLIDDVGISYYRPEPILFDDGSVFSQPLARRSSYQTQKLQLSPERIVIALLLNNPELAKEVTGLDELGHLDNDEARLFIYLLEILKEDSTIGLDPLIFKVWELYGAGVSNLLEEIAANETFHTSPKVARDDRAEFNHSFDQLKLKALNGMQAADLVKTLQARAQLTTDDKNTIYKALAKGARGGLTDEVRHQLKLLSRQKTFDVCEAAVQ